MAGTSQYTHSISGDDWGARAPKGWPQTVPDHEDTHGPVGGSGNLSQHSGPMGYDAPFQFNGVTGGAGETEEHTGDMRPDEVLGHNSQMFMDVMDQGASGGWRGADYMGSSGGWTEC